MLRTDRESVFLNKLSFRSVVRFLSALVLMASGTILCAQTVTIKLVNGRNGHPMSHTCIDLGVDHVDHMLAIPTDNNGAARFYVTENDAEVDIQKRWTDCGNWGVIDPVVKRDMIGIHVGYVLCQFRKPDYSWLSTMNISTKQLLELLQQGIVLPNTCGKATASPKPGELVIFVRPLSWWETLKQ